MGLHRFVESARRVTGVVGTAGAVADAAANAVLRTAGAAVATGAAVTTTTAAVGLASPPGRLVNDVVSQGSRLAGRAARTAADVPARGAAIAADLAHQGVSAVQQAPRQALWSAKALLDPHPRRTHRRVWENQGHAQIEVRGLTGDRPRDDHLPSRVKSAVGRLSGVRWAEINAVTGQVMVAFDQRRVDLETVLDTVRSVENAAGTRHEDFPWERPVHPSDVTPLASALVELAADWVALNAALAGRILRVPALPRGVRVGLTLLDLQPRLRRQLSAQIGPLSTDVLMSLTYSAVLGLSQRPIGPALSMVQQTQLLAEVLARRAVWRRREPEFCQTPEGLPHEAPERRPRPQPLPPGPLETWSDRLGPGSFVGSLGVLLLTREPRRAADTILAAVPRAARLGRESFAATAARRLARRGVVPLDASVYRRLDRMSAIVVDSEVLCSDRPQILTAEPEGDAELRFLWREATRLLRGESLAALRDGARLEDGKLRLEKDPRAKRTPRGAVSLVLRRGNRRLGRLTVGGELAPLAEALVDAARETGLRVLLTEHAVVAELVAQADELVGADEPLAEAVRRLQSEGHGVLCVSGGDEDALAAADAGVGVLGESGGCGCWSADLVGGPGLEDAWRVLRVVAAARPLSQRVVHVAQAATALGVLLALVGGRRRGKTHALAPVHTSAVVGLLQGARAGRGATRGRAPAPVVHVQWHALDPEDVLDRLDEAASNGHRRSLGRTLADVAERGRALADKPLPRRVLAPARGTVALSSAMREELQDPLTPVLALGATASAVVGSVVDAALVATVLTGNAFVSGAQRLSAEQALSQLMAEQTVRARRVEAKLADLRAVVEGSGDDREAGRRELDSLHVRSRPAPRLVAGDVIALQPSEVVPADARLLAAWDLEVDESTLTGESVPVDKGVEATPGAPVPERTCMVFEGTTVLAGSGYAVVVATGDSTEAGRATRAAGRAAPAAGVQARLAEITHMALPATALGGAGVAGLGLLRGLPLREAIAAGVSVAVAAVPEGLPLVATVAQAGAARRLSRQGVLVRSSRTLEALGRVDTVCFDKTGTLTTGRLSVTRVTSPSEELDLDEPAGKRVLSVAARACPAVEPEEIADVPHATDRAVLEAANGAVEDDWELVRESYFEANRGYSASLGRSDGTVELAVKGAPEVVLPLCTSVRDGDGTDPRPLDESGRSGTEETVARLADEGLRLLAVAERRTGLPDRADDVEPLVDELTLIGFVGISDSPREGASDAVRRMAEAGLRPVMVTGDHPATASAIARAVGLPAEQVLTGAELEQMTEEERVRRAAETTIFARVSPEQKVRIVEALRGSGRVVAMTGDGTNDAAAIRLADVGIGVGGAGSISARSAADLVLAEPDLTLMHDALVESRAMWHRMQEAVSILVGGNAGEVGFMMLGTAVAGRAPINIRQMLVVNLLTDMFPALAVALAAGRDGGSAAPVDSALGASLARTVAIRGTTTALGATLAWTIGRYTGRGRRADSMGLVALVGTQLGQTLLTDWRSPLVVATTLASVAVLLAIVETPGVSQLFGCTPIGPLAWTVAIAASLVGTVAAAGAQRRFANA